MTSVQGIVSSRDNALVKALRRLSEDGASYRKSGRVWIEGEHLCEAAHERGWRAEIVVISEKHPELAHLPCAQSAAKLVVLADALMREVSALDSPAAIGMVLALPAQHGIESNAASVVLDRLQDPGNAGSILRSAAAFGCAQVIALKGTVALWSPKVLRAGMGAHFSLHITEAASIEQVQELKRPLAVTSSHRGQFLHELQALAMRPDQARAAQQPHPLLADLAWVLGHEGQGVSEELAALATAHVRIAQPGGQESLNVAAAAAICLHASAAARAV